MRSAVANSCWAARSASPESSCSPYRPTPFRKCLRASGDCAISSPHDKRKATAFATLRPANASPAGWVSRIAGGDLGMHAAARHEIADQCRGDGLGVFHDVGQHAIDNILLKDAEIAVGQRIHLERFQLQTKLTGNVT